MRSHELSFLSALVIQDVHHAIPAPASSFDLDPNQTAPSVLPPRTSNTIRPVALDTYFLCTALVPLVAYERYSTFGNILLPSRRRAEPSNIQVRKSELEPYLTHQVSPRWCYVSRQLTRRSSVLDCFRL
ncbi:hypothetical protein FA13DRAFT_1732658 [Coprinellus micaceus]|uniref:Uncharacterized protein n=1 Tax=Coprinellus micaceus TaxID=71717 RepID=A0A4Y7TB99_COPMI|nr:hypothetical protein FA13DRAFT_1732658 [Coprinellus micaceus]